MFLATILFMVNFGFLLAAVYFTYESVKEDEPRAPMVGAAGIVLHSSLAGLIVFAPGLRGAVAVLLAVLIGLILLFFRRGKITARAFQGTKGYIVGPVKRFDERDVVFARNRSLRPDSAEYKTYYTELRPEKEAGDAKRRQRGGPLGKPGSIDGGYLPNVAMLISSFEVPNLLGSHAKLGPAQATGGTYKAQPGASAGLDPEKASNVVKGWARRLGADLVGVCRTNELWSYSHRGEIHYGEWDQWGKPIPEPLPYAVVIATEMHEDTVRTAPHTPSVVESGYNYARGAFVTTALARWFAVMGYQARAEHNRHYESLLVPMAVEAGLGEMGRHGYLISDKFGARIRLFAVQTDMPLAPDKPIDLGVEAFCERCLKCAESCPSRSIATGPQIEINGIMRWKLNEDTCFDYWGKVGTDCCVCMAVCPFSRPNRPVHQIVRWALRRSNLARSVFPHVDNFMYGKKWRPRVAPEWIRYPSAANKEGQGKTKEE